MRKPLQIYVLLTIITVYLLFIVWWSRTKLEEVPFYTARRAPAAEGPIPFILHEYWHSRRMPPRMAEVVRGHRDMNPDFDVYVYSERDAKEFLRDNYGADVLAAFHALKPSAYRSDLFRYCVLYVKGGVWIDTKMEFSVPLRQLVRGNPIFMNTKDGWCDGRGIMNAFIIVPPKNEVLGECIKRIVATVKARGYGENDLDVTGPCLVGKVLDEKELSAQRDHSRCVCSEEDHRFVFHCDGQVVARSYKEYRDDQALLEKEPHYKALYKKRDMYW